MRLLFDPPTYPPQTPVYMDTPDGFWMLDAKSYIDVDDNFAVWALGFPDFFKLDEPLQ